VGPRAAAELQPLHEHLRQQLKASSHLFCDETRCPVLDPGRGKRSIRGLALNRKNALFAGHDLGAENRATIASLVETCKLNAVDPLAWMTDVLTRLVNLWPATRIDELIPWAYVAKSA
jgi:transposase